MKIYKLSNQNVNKEGAKNIIRTFNDIIFLKSYKKASGGENYIQISPDSIANMNRASVITDEKISILKTTENIIKRMNLIHEINNYSPNYDHSRVERVKNCIKTGQLNFENDEIINKTADILLTRKYLL